MTQNLSFHDSKVISSIIIQALNIKLLDTIFYFHFFFLFAANIPKPVAIISRLLVSQCDTNYFPVASKYF